MISPRALWPKRWPLAVEPLGDVAASPHAQELTRKESDWEIKRRRRKARRRTLRKLLAPVERSNAHVSAVYEDEYAESTEEFARSREQRRDAFVVDRRAVKADGWFSVEFRGDILQRVADATRAERVLEVGAGRGFNLTLLALRRPALELEGIELTEAGVVRSRELAAAPPEELVKLAGSTAISDDQRAALARIVFAQGDAREMPYADDAFDVSFTCLVLEQIPDAYPDVLREMVRVTRRYCAFVEPFADANGLLGRAQLRSLDYFRTSYKRFGKFGLEPVYFSTAYPQKVHFKTGLMIAEVLR